MVRHHGWRLFMIAAFLTAIMRPAGALAVEIGVDNYVRPCVKIGLEQPKALENRMTVDAALDLRNSLAECGCKSAGIDYSVYQRIRGEEIYVLGGKLAVTQSRRAELALSPEGEAVPPGQSIRLTLGCAQPE